MSKDIIFINQLTTQATIGVHAWEQKITQPLLWDLQLSTDIKPAAKSDDLSLTIDYQKVCAMVTDWVEKHPCQLLETLAEQILELLFTMFKISHIELTVTKPGAIPNAKNVGLHIKRAINE